MEGERAAGTGTLGRLSKTLERVRDTSVTGANRELELDAAFAELASLPPAERYRAAKAAFGSQWQFWLHQLGLA